MEPQKRTHLVNELMEEAMLMKTVLKKAMEGQQVEAQQKEKSQHIVEDEPNPLPTYTIEEEYAAWEKISQALAEIQTGLDQIEHAERQRRERLSPHA
jgi:hypothetical protein